MKVHLSPRSIVTRNGAPRFICTLSPPLPCCQLYAPRVTLPTSVLLLAAAGLPFAWAMQCPPLGSYWALAWPWLACTIAARLFCLPCLGYITCIIPFVCRGGPVCPPECVGPTPPQSGSSSRSVSFPFIPTLCSPSSCSPLLLPPSHRAFFHVPLALSRFLRVRCSLCFLSGSRIYNSETLCVF